MIYPYIVVHNGKWYNAGEEVPEKGASSNGYTKTDINRMSIDDLKALGAEQEIENAEELKGDDLKKLLIEKLGL